MIIYRGVIRSLMTHFDDPGYLSLKFAVASRGITIALAEIGVNLQNKSTNLLKALNLSI